MLYRVYYAAFVKDSSATGAPSTPYKIMDVKSEPVPAITTTEAPAQQQATSFSYPATHPISSSFQNSIPSVTNTYTVPSVQPRLSDRQPPVTQFHPPPIIPEATQLPQPRSDAPPPPTISSYQPSAPPPGGSNWNDPPVVVKTKKVIICN